MYAKLAWLANSQTPHGYPVHDLPYLCQCEIAVYPTTHARCHFKATLGWYSKRCVALACRKNAFVLHLCKRNSPQASNTHLRRIFLQRATVVGCHHSLVFSNIHAFIAQHSMTILLSRLKSHYRQWSRDYAGCRTKWMNWCQLIPYHTYDAAAAVKTLRP